MCDNCGHYHGWAVVGWGERDRREQWCSDVDCDCWEYAGEDE
jgi:hypothetical protein